jgi:hypothetical protein
MIRLFRVCFFVRHRSSIASCILLGAGVAALAASGAAQSGIQARRAGDFVGSMGINVHMGYTHTPYAKSERIYAKLQALGMRNFRDEINNTHPEFVAKLQHIGSLSYALCGLIEGGNDYPEAGSTLEASAVVPMILNLRPYIEAVEGPNEPDDPTTPPFAYGPGYELFPQGAIQESKDLWNIVQGNREISDLPVLGMSEGNPQDFLELAAATQTPIDFANFGNMHAYQGGGVGDAGLPAYAYYARTLTGSTPLWITEMGYHNNTNYLSDGEQQGVSPRASAIYLPTAFLSAFNAGAVRIFSYELVDETYDPHPTSESGGEGHYGLLNYDFTPKPAYTALQNLITLLRDTGAQDFQPAPLEMEFTGAPNSMRYALLQKSNDDFYLALWNNVSVYQTATAQSAGEDLYPPDVPITIAFSTPHNLVVYAPNDSTGTNPTASYTVSATTTSLAIDLPPQLLLIRITAE